MRELYYVTPSICIMYLKQIITRNLQNHREVVIDLPPTGLVVFTGQNSNGKSVIVKTLRTALNGDLRKPRKRASLVNRKASFAELTCVRDDDTRLTIHVAREANVTFVKYEVPGEEPIVRYLADKSYSDLLTRFGWHYDKETGISLNIAEEEDALLFYKTPNKANGSCLESATTDSVANKVAESFETTLKDARSFREQCIQQVRTYSSALKDLTTEPIAPMQEKRELLCRYLRNLEKIYFPTIPEIKAVPRVHYVEIHQPVLPTVKYPRIVDIQFSIPDIVPVASELKTLREHRCPTCGRGFDCACENTVCD